MYIKHIAYELQYGNIDRVRDILASNPLPAVNALKRIQQVLLQLPKQEELRPQHKALMKKFSEVLYRPCKAVTEPKGTHPLQTQPDIVAKVLSFLSPGRKDNLHGHVAHYSPLWGVAGVNALFSESVSLAHMELLKERLETKSITYAELEEFQRVLGFPTVISLVSFFRKECLQVEKFSLKDCSLMPKNIESLSQYFPGVKEIDDDVHGFFIKQNHHLRRIEFSGLTYINDDLLRAIAANCLDLESIAFATIFVSREAFSDLIKGASKLKELKLRSECSDEGLISIGEHCKELTSFSIEESSMTERGLAAIAEGCPKLQHLNLIKSYRISTQGAIAVFKSQFGCLTSVNLNGCGWATDAVVEALAESNRALKEANLRLRYIGFKGLMSLANNCPELKSLDVSHSENVTDPGIAILASGCSKLERLNIAGNAQLTCAAIDALIKYAPQLRSIYLSDSPWLTTESVIAVAQFFPHLEEIDVSRCNIELTGYLALAQYCPSLRKVPYCPKDIAKLALYVGCRNLDVEYMETYFTDKIKTLLSHRPKSPSAKLLQALIRRDPPYKLQNFVHENAELHPYKGKQPIELFISLLSDLQSINNMFFCLTNICEILSIADNLVMNRKRKAPDETTN